MARGKNFGIALAVLLVPWLVGCIEIKSRCALTATYTLGSNPIDSIRLEELSEKLLAYEQQLKNVGYQVRSQATSNSKKAVLLAGREEPFGQVDVLIWTSLSIDDLALEQSGRTFEESTRSARNPGRLSIDGQAIAESQFGVTVRACVATPEAEKAWVRVRERLQGILRTH